MTWICVCRFTSSLCVLMFFVAPHGSYSSQLWLELLHARETPGSVHLSSSKCRHLASRHRLYVGAEDAGVDFQVHAASSPPTEPSSSPEDFSSIFFTEFTSSKHKIFQVFKVGSSISHRLLMLAHIIALCMTLKVENSFGLWRKKCIRYVQWSSQCFILGILTCSLTKLPKLGRMNLCWCHPSEAWNHFLEFFFPLSIQTEKGLCHFTEWNQKALITNTELSHR